jgi:glycosyltransferase involved in cell wall biosynthesis
VNNKSKHIKKIWLVSEVFYPEEVATSYIMTEIALSLANENDIEVHVICGPEDYEKKSTISDTSYVQKLKIHRVNIFNFNKNRAISRLLRILGISLALFFIGAFRIKRRDKVFLVTNPATVIPLYSILKKIIGFQFTILVHDVFPENLIVAKYIKSKNFIYSTLKSIFDFSYKTADKLIVLGIDMQRLLMSKTNFDENKVEIIQNWADTGNVFPIPFVQNELISDELKSKIIIQYAGNFGPLQNLIEFLDIIRKVQNPDLHFVFIGRGAKEVEMKKFKEKHQMLNVSFWPAFNRFNQNMYLNACHFGIVSLTDELIGLGVPSKTYNIMAAEKPIIFIGNRDTEIAQMLDNQNCGLCFSFNESDKLIGFFNQLKKNYYEDYLYLGKNGVHLANNLFSKHNILNKFNKLLLESN